MFVGSYLTSTSQAKTTSGMGHGLQKLMASVLAKPQAPLIAIIGCTGTGKSQLAVDLARKYHGEVINGDAMQLYQGLDIITNKIPLGERLGIPHNLLGCIGLNEQPWSTRDFAPRALKAIKDIHSRQKIPILVGGTHYYLQSVLFRDTLAGTDLTKSQKEKDDGHEWHPSKPATVWPILDAPTNEILSKLQEVDPTIAKRWHPNDRRKIQRSLEIWLRTGRRASEVYEEQRAERAASSNSITPSASEKSGAQAGMRFPTLLLWTYTPREPLNNRLDGRVHNMMENGLLDEVKSLRELGRSTDFQQSKVDDSRGIWQSIGYRQFLPYLESIEAGSSEKEQAKKRDEAITQTQAATRQYSRSQERWIRIKLLHALREANAQDSLFVVDTATPSEWESTVLQPAYKCCDAFLSGSDLPRPDEIYEGALTILSPLREYDVSQRADTWGTWTCEACDVTVTMKEQWEKHIQGRRHRKLVKKKADREEHVTQPAKDLADAQ